MIDINFLVRCCQYMKKRKEAGSMKGYVVDSGYMGYVDGRYELFADESDYMEVYKEMQG